MRWKTLATLWLLPALGWGLPNEIAQEGLLVDAQGQPLEGRHTFQVRLYLSAQGGAPLFDEVHPDVELVEGYYFLPIGSLRPLPEHVFERPTLFLGLGVDRGPELAPRTALRKVPAAFYADVAGDAVGDIHPTSVTIGATLVINPDGQWVGPAANIQGPAGPVGPAGPPGPPGGVGGDGSPDTPQQVHDKLIQVDGAGSGVDADLLDGLSSDRFLRVGQPIDADTLQGHAADEFARTPQQVLDRLVQVDGQGSAVDADRLDGIDSTQFVQTADQILGLLRTVDGQGSGLDADRLDGVDGSELVRTAEQVLALLRTVDGQGSGVDADRLDGLDSTQFFRTNGDVDLAGALNVQGPVTLGGALRVSSADQAPGACDAAASGSVYLNSDTGHFMGCNGSEWVRLSGGGGGGEPGGDKELVENNGVRSWSNGTFSRSCKAYREDVDYNGAGSGVYRLRTGRDTFDAYCDMRTDGGGWTMVGHYRHPASVNGPAGHDNRDYAYYMRARTSLTYGNDPYLANPNSAGPWTDWRPLDGMGWPVEFAVVLDQGNYAEGWENYPAKVLYRVKDRDVMPNYGTSQNLTAGDNLLYRVNSGDPWLDVGSSSASGTYYWYPYNAANAYLVLFHVSNYRYLDGRAPTDYHHSNYYGSGLPAGDNSWHHGSRLLVRETAAPFDPNVGRHIRRGDDGVRTWSDGALDATCKTYRTNADYRGDTGDGVYRITVPGGNADVYCDMTTDGGGWTLAGHYRHPANEGALPDHDNRDYAYYMKAHSSRFYGNPVFAANPDSAGPWTDWRPLDNMGWPVEMAVVLDQGSYASGWENYDRKVIYRVKDRAIMPNWGTSQNLTSGDNLLYKLSTQDGWTDVGSSSASGTYYWYPYDAANAYLTLFHVSNYRYLDGRDPTAYHHANYYGAGVRNGDNSWHHGSRLLVRETAAPLPQNQRRLVVADDGARTWSDGIVEPTCKAYRRSDDYRGAIGDGLYRVQTAVGPVVVYCDMNTDGGGWTVVGNYRHPAYDNAPDDHDNRDYAYYMRARTDAAYGRPQYYGDPNSDGAWTDWRPLSTTGFPLEFAVLLDMGGETFHSGWEGHGRKAVYRVRDRNIMPNHGTEQDLRSGDNLLYRFNLNEAWIDVGDSSASGTYYWYPGSSGNAHLTLFHVSNYRYLDGRAATNHHHSNNWGAGMGGDSSWHHESRLLVRSLD